MKKFYTLPFVAFLLLFGLATTSTAQVAPGEAAPAFRATDAAGKSHTLSEYIGEWLVLEWFNHECDTVKALYDSGKMQSLQETYTEKGVQWLTVISSGRGKEGYLEPEPALALAEELDLSASAPFLLDATGVMGRAFDVKRTPHLFVIDPKGVIVYTGALYDQGEQDLDETRDYVGDALESSMNNAEVETPATPPHGCPIPYL